MTDPDRDLRGFVPVCGAELSPDGIYRYRLWRGWGDGTRVAFIMLNPSTADAEYDDPTIRRCMGFARSWGFDGIEVLNLFALRATDPRSLLVHAFPVGPENNRRILEIVRDPCIDLCVAAWGAAGKWYGRDAYVRQLIAQAGVTLRCLGRTKAGHPKHPLYLRSDLRPEPLEAGHVL